jgi:predicted PurR-regulated permease PerM
MVGTFLECIRGRRVHRGSVLRCADTSESPAAWDRNLFRLYLSVLIAIVIAYIINPLVSLIRRTIFRKIEQDAIARNLSILCSIVLVITLFVVLVVALIPQLISSIATFVNNLDGYAYSVNRWLSSLNQKTASSNIDISRLTELGNTAIEKITSSLPDIMDRVINTSYSIGTGFATGVIAFILAIYMLLDKTRLQTNCSKALKYIVPVRHYKNVTRFLNRCNTILIRYIVCDLLDGLIVGVANYIFMKAAGMPYGLLISIVVGVTNLAPTFGPIFGAVIGAFILLLVNPWYSLWFLIFTLILQTGDGYVIKPKLFGETLGVSSLWILICIIVGGRMFGVVGILIAIPFAAISDFIFREYFIPWLKRRRQAAKQAAEENAKSYPSDTEHADQITGNLQSAANIDSAASGIASNNKSAEPDAAPNKKLAVPGTAPNKNMVASDISSNKKVAAPGAAPRKEKDQPEGSEE